MLLFVAQTSHDESPGNGPEDVFVTKRVKAISIVFMYFRHLDPGVWIVKLLRVIWQRAIALSEAVG